MTTYRDNHQQLCDGRWDSAIVVRIVDGDTLREFPVVPPLSVAPFATEEAARAYNAVLAAAATRR